MHDENFNIAIRRKMYHHSMGEKSLSDKDLDKEIEKVSNDKVISVCVLTKASVQ